VDSLKPVARYLWGTALESIEFDIEQLSITAVIKRLANGEETSHRLEFRDVADWHFFNSIPTPWTYAELTEVYENTSHADGRHIELTLWDEAAQIIVQAKSVILDGQPLSSENQEPRNSGT
jgi:hypothetical protein